MSPHSILTRPPALGYYTDTTTLAAESAKLGNVGAVGMWFQSIGNGWDGVAAESIRAAGLVVVSTLLCPGWVYSDIYGGVHDAAIDAYADGLVAWGHDIVIRLDAEFDGGWAPAWGVLAAGNSAADFVLMWRYIVDRFRARGATTKVRWYWCPNNIGGGGYSPIANCYPGDAYVDIVGVDGYNWGTWEDYGQISYENLIGPSYDLFTANWPDKPFWIGEFGCADDAYLSYYGYTKAEWFALLPNALRTRTPHVRVVIYADSDFGTYPAANPDWRIESGTGALAAWKAGPMANWIGIAP